MEPVIVLCTCPTAEARDLATTLLEERYVACASMSDVTSRYIWNDDVEEAEETLLVMKTVRKQWPTLRERIRELHSYDVPEVLMVPVSDGAADYLAWLDSVIA
jgi:periplasmic divalent cation tolerance protein